MSIGPINSITASIAGAGHAHTHGADSARANHELAAQQLRAASLTRAATAEGVGATDGEDNEASDRDADGRRLWEVTPTAHRKSPTEESPEPPTPVSKDATGESGHSLDLSG